MIAAVPFRKILDDPSAGTLLAEYEAECELPELGPTKPQPQLYEMMEKSGNMQAFGVYEGETLVGFAVVIVYPLPHYGKTIAATESIFISAEHRKNGNYGRLKAHIVAYAKSRGCAAFQFTAPVGSRFEQVLNLTPACRRSNSVFIEAL